MSDKLMTQGLLFCLLPCAVVMQRQATGVGRVDMHGRCMLPALCTSGSAWWNGYRRLFGTALRALKCMLAGPCHACRPSRSNLMPECIPARLLLHARACLLTMLSRHMHGCNSWLRIVPTLSGWSQSERASAAELTSVYCSIDQ